uniref:SEC7 domain-containing protein n=1 Tax=Meloidogyne incognita TaxID=6306 RepID=A0A914KGD0_MELIC
MRPTQILILDEEEETQNNGSNESIPNSYLRSQSPGMLGTPTSGLVSGREHHVMHIQSGHSSPRQNAFNFGSTKCIAQSPLNNTASPLRRRQPPPPLHLCNSGENNKAIPAQSRQSIWVPRQFAFACPNSMPMHRRHLQQRQILSNAMMQHSNDQKYNYEQKFQYHHHPTLPVTRSSSIARTDGNNSTNNNNSFPQTTFNNLLDNSNTGSLPRLNICNKNNYDDGRQQHNFQQVGGVGVTILSGGGAGGGSGSVGRELPKHLLLKQQPSIGCGSAHSSSSTTTAAAAPVGVTEMQLHTEWSEQQRRRLYRIALNFFNKKPDRGIQLLIRWGFVEESPPVIARLFRERRGLSRQMIGEYLGTLRSPFHKKVLEHFISDLPMHNVEIDIALRQLLKHFRLPGEAQKIDHIIQTFAHIYVAYNPHLSSKNGTDSMYILAFAVIMLNTDLHTPSLKDSRRMKLDEFIKNLCRVEEGKNLDKFGFF